MTAKDPNKLVIAISSRALFDLGESHAVYQDQGLQAYSEYQIAHEEEPLEPGEAFPLVQKMLRLNSLLGNEAQVEVVLLSRNSADTGLRVFTSIQHYGLPITRAAFCGGESPWRYINAFGCQLFLSNEAEDVRYALDCGVAAATLVSNKGGNSDSDQLRFAFDGDAVVFSDEAERVFKSSGSVLGQRAGGRQDAAQWWSVQALPGSPAPPATSVSRQRGPHPHRAGHGSLGPCSRAGHTHPAGLEYPYRRIHISRWPEQDRIPACVSGRCVF